MPSFSSRALAPATADAAGFFGPCRFTLTGSMLRAFTHRPADSIGIVVLVAAACAILANALYLQKGPHPAPLLMPPAQPIVASDTTGSLIVIPRPRPAGSETGQNESGAGVRPRAQVITDIQRELARRGFYDGAVDGVYGPKMDAAIRDFEQAEGLKATGEPSETLLQSILRSTARAAAQRPAGAAIPAVRRAEPGLPNTTPSTRVAAVQRALADFGYGQIKPSGVFDAATKAAIEKFERERKLPVTGQLTGRLTRELAAVTGRPLE